MMNSVFKPAWPEYFDVIAQLEWSEPYTHDELFSGKVKENVSAYFYSIVAQSKRVWWPYYIGMTMDQTVAARNQALDHIERMERLRIAYPKLNFMVTLGTPFFSQGQAKRDVIYAIEGLLIYGNWHSDMVNEKKIQTFNSIPHIFIENIGWIEHVEKELAFGVFYSSGE
ncbi:hypothetical protein ONV78_30510 [Hahella sp. CR1]|uniref:hypothetical protein n=1 Tax=Hahella sp. CR1 TaxID=2992807 RepID=UPI00244242AC|nr:hypothetical protein [Hahella sp. CR1]MDG9672105.1 hypothetical protein [Hahella sp. CR1]